MKLLWDAIGTEFGGRHELYEINYAGNHEDIRIQALFNARSSGTYDKMVALADQCMADYDEKGWTGDTWLNPDDVAYPGVPGTATRGGVTSRRHRARVLSWFSALGDLAARPFSVRPSMSWIDQRPDDAMMGSFEASARSTSRPSMPAPFREAMSRLGAAVHVVTTEDPPAGGCHRDRGGLGVRSARDVARLPQPPQPGLADPAREPRVLRQHAARRRGQHRRCVRRPHRMPMAERFDSGAWTELSTGAPALTDAVVAFDCRVIEIKVVGDAITSCSPAWSRCRLGRAGPARSSITSGPTSRFATAPTRVRLRDFRMAQQPGHCPRS